MADVKCSLVVFNSGDTSIPHLHGEVPKFVRAWLASPVTAFSPTPQTVSLCRSHGMSDFTTTASHTSYAANGQLTTTASHYRSLTSFLVEHDDSAVIADATLGTPTTTEIPLTWSGTPSGCLCVAQIWSGADFNAHVYNINTTSTTHNVTTNFQTDVLFGHSATYNNYSGSIDTLQNSVFIGTGVWSRGQGGSGSACFYENGRDTSRGRMAHYDDAVGISCRNATSGDVYAWTVTAIDATSYTLGVLPAASSTPNYSCSFAALGFGGNGFDHFQVVDGGTGATVPRTLGWEPGMLFLCGSARTLNVADPDHQMITEGLADKEGNQFVSTFNGQRQLSTSQIPTVVNDGDSWVAHVLARENSITPLFRADGYDLDFIETGGETRIADVIAVECTVPTGGPGPGPTPSITQLTPNWLADGQPNNSITGTDFEAQGAGSKVEVTDGSTTVEATVGSWTDTLISDITYNTTGVNLGAVSVLVTNNTGNTSDPAAAEHVATLPSTGLVTSEDLNARMTRPATQALSPTEDAEFTKHVSNTAIGETIIIPSAGVS